MLRATLLLLLTTAPATVSASAPAIPRSSIQDYVRARAAAADGRFDDAARGFAAALALAPDDPVIATRAYRQAISGGDQALAMSAARRLAAQAMLPPDGRMLFVVQAVTARDWKGADAAVSAIAAEPAFSFLIPVMRAWIAMETKSGDPVALLDTSATGPLARAYAAEHRGFLLLAVGRYDEGIAAIRANGDASGGRQLRLKLAAAALLAKRDRREAALAMLAGSEPELVAARARIADGGSLPAPVDGAAAGIAELLVRVAIDLTRERPTPLALGLARMATFLAPESSETWLVTAELLAASDSHAEAGAALDRIAADDPFAASARRARTLVLLRSGEKQAALVQAEATAAGTGATAADWMRVGDVRSALDRPGPAADAYGRAAALATPDTLWTALLLQGGALEEAGQWPAAKAVLERARAAAPDQALILNLLGYAQLERRENMASAQSLIEQASRLRPDDASITDSLGWAYYLRGDVAKAIPKLEQAAVGDPGQSAINEHLGDAYWSAGRRFEARYAWRAALIGAEADAVARIQAKIDRGWSVASAAP